MIELQNLTKRFGELTAVNDVTLTVNRGEFFAVGADRFRQRCQIA